MSLLATKTTDKFAPEELVQVFARTQVMMKSVGASPYGGNLSKWPARMVDVFVVLQEEHTRVENLRMSSPKPPVKE